MFILHAFLLVILKYDFIIYYYFLNGSWVKTKQIKAHFFFLSYQLALGTFFSSFPFCFKEIQILKIP